MARMTGSTEITVNYGQMRLRAVSGWAQVMHAMRRALERKLKQGISLRRLRERYLKVAATVRVHARRITVVIAQSAAELWQVMTRLLERMPVMVW